VADYNTEEVRQSTPPVAGNLKDYITKFDLDTISEENGAL
jgi:hypothetical protein